MMADQGRNTATHQTSDSNDVFLSFCGPDTRHSFTGSLYHALTSKGFKVFMDDQAMKPGDRISQTLVNAIQQSRISIVVLSQNYASSTWCLDELVEILECERLKKQLVWPIFYKVEPSDVRHQRKSFAKAMEDHEQKLGDESNEVQKWRSALPEVASLKGWHYTTGQYDHELIEEIVEQARTKLKREQLDVGEHIIGHQTRIEEVKSLLDIESQQMVCMLGIYGIGGVGKTTLATALYNLINHQFEFAIFLEDVREKSNSSMGLVHLQKEILSKFEGKKIKLGGVREGVSRLKGIFQHRRVLLLLDDVDEEDQLEKLAGNCNWFGSGSRIIITTRDKNVLDLFNVDKRFEMKGLNDDEALQLFCWKAFKESKPPMNYEMVSKRAVQYASCLPLALKVIGSHLAKKSVKGCEDALKQYEKIPNRKIQEILKISYDSLEEYAKKMFLDIACFFKGKSLGNVQPLWEKCEFFPSNNIEILVNKSLITIESDILWMHDLIQDMGKEIVRLEDKNPGKRSRLYYHQDVLKILGENLGSDQIEGIMLDPPEEKEVNWNDNAFKKMNNLRILIIRKTYFTQELDYLPNSLKLLDWMGYPSKSLPSGFDPINIVVLNLPCSHLTLEEAKPFQNLGHLTHFNFSGCQYITHFPDVSGVPNLSELDLSRCRNLVAIHQSVGFLQHLKRLIALDCTKLEDFPSRMLLPSLQELELAGTSIALFPHIEGNMCAPLEINLSVSLIKELPDSVSNLIGLELIQMNSLNVTVESLPTELFMLPNMSTLYLNNCGVAVRESLQRLLNSHAMATTGRSTFNKPRYSPLRELSCPNCGLTDEDLDIILSCFPNLEELYISGNEFVSLPASIKGSTTLIHLDVCDCLKLEEIPELPKSIERVTADGCPCLSSEALKMLWSQASHQLSLRGGKVEQGLTEIPDWFDHHCKGGTVSFQARRKFPVLAIAFILEEHAWLKSINFYINGELYSRIYGLNANKNVTIFDLDSLFVFNYGKRPIIFREHGWDNVAIEIECECKCYYGSRCNVNNCNVSSCGAYVYKQKTNTEDIRFTVPNH